MDGVTKSCNVLNVWSGKVKVESVENVVGRVVVERVV